MSHAQTAEAVFSGTRHGYGFAEGVPGVEGSVFLPAHKTRYALDGDRIRIRYVISARDGRAEGEVLEVLENEDYHVTGTLVSERIRGVRGERQHLVIPDSAHLPERIEIDDPGPAVTGDKVLLVLSRKTRDAYVERSFGRADTLGANYEAILSECDIEVDFDPDVLAEADAVASAPLSREGRATYNFPILTLDGPDAKDLDDAVSVVKTESGYTLGVHIADVSEYVAPSSALDRAAMKRATSVYFTDKVVPMLPPSLSNGACSLNPGEDKYALSAIMTFDSLGNFEGVRVEKSVIRSRLRGVYEEVNDLLARKEESEFYEKYAPLFPTLLDMHALYLLLARKAKERGMLELDGADAQILLDEVGIPVSVIKRVRGDAERMIEEFMLAANRAVAQLLHKEHIPCVYRVHDAPPAEKLPAFFDYAHNLDLSVAPLREKEALTALDFANLLKEAEEKGLSEALEYPLLRTMAKAKYSEQAQPHFGLSFPLYCHFTSPIRRLSDLATHRILKSVLLEGERAIRLERYAAKAARCATEGELRALQAERKIEALYKTLYLSRHEGEEHMARITSVTSFGMFAILENTCEGLIPIEQMPGFFTFHEKTLSLVGKNMSFHIADTVRIRIEEGDLSQMRTRFSLILP